MRTLVAFVLCAAIAAGCGKDPEEDLQTEIIIGNKEMLSHNVYADQTYGESEVTFVTTGAWTSAITEKTANATSAGTLSWISISPESGDEAGEYTIIISLEPNITGANRAAEITIMCNGAEVKITVTQQAITEEGEVLKPYIRLLTEKNGEVVIRMAGSGTVTIDWHNGYVLEKSETYSLSAYDANSFSSDMKYSYTHTFYETGRHIIAISGENITHIDCRNNEIVHFESSDNPQLTYINCANNQFDQLNIIESALTYLDCSNSEYWERGIFQVHCPALTYLNCSNNGLKNLPLGIYENLTYLDCSNNELGQYWWGIDNELQQMSKLETLNCSNNELTDLVFYNNPSLVNLQCQLNKIGRFALNNLFKSLHNNEIADVSKTIYIAGNPENWDCDKSIAENKGWTVDTETMP